MLFWIVAALIILLIAGLVLYWQLILAEGAYLGAPLVALLYDWTAERYNKIKEFEPEMEDFWVGGPLVQRLRRRPQALVLDVATGTGRIPLNLLRQPSFRGRIIGLDRASKMLAVARRDLTASQADRVSLIQADAMALPFASDTFPAVVCMEALEFLPDPGAGLAELIRVLQPAAERSEVGWLLTTQRIGWEARLMPGKTWNQDQLLKILIDFPLQHIEIQIWQDIYNLVWAQKVKKP